MVSYLYTRYFDITRYKHFYLIVTNFIFLAARVIVDRETGRSRGFGFITYATPEDASSAIQALDGQVLLQNDGL